MTVIDVSTTPSGSHLQSQSDVVSSVDGIYVPGYCPDWSIKLPCYWL